MFKKLLLGAVAVFLLLVLIIRTISWWFDWYGRQAFQATDGSKILEFTVKPGTSLKKIANSLSERGWLHYPKLFIMLARVEKVTRAIHAGEYMIPSGISHRELLNIFVFGRVRYFDVTFMAGQTLSEALALLNSHEKLSNPMGQEALEAFLKNLDIQGSPEGLFYPDTYFFQAGDSVQSVLQRSYEKLNSVLILEWKKRAENLPYCSAYDALIMASLIEKETGASCERSKIAGVFVRRLKNGMLLQADPTVIYGLGKNYKGNLSRHMLKTWTPYNTYKIKGLPPSPIALVGQHSIRAALHPKNGHSLYFVAKGDGTHYFSNTLAEHNRSVKKYQQ